MPAIVRSAAAAPCPVCSPAIQHFGVSEGLSHNAVIAITQDNDGFVWLGTRDGLDRLDGSSVQRFDQLAGHDLRAERLVALAAAGDGGLWIGLRDALLLRESSGAVRDIALASNTDDDSMFVSRLLTDPNGVWVGLDGGLLRVDGARGVAQRVPALDGEPVRGLQRLDDALLVLAGREQCHLWWIDPASLTSRRQLEAPCAAALLLQDGRLRLDSSVDWSLKGPLPPESNVNSQPVVLPWRRGAVFAGVGGAFWRSPEGDVHRLGLEEGLGSEVLTAFVDTDDALWLGTYDGALRLDPDMPAFGGLDDGPLDRLLAERAVSDIAFFDRRWWFGSFDQGLLSWDEATASIRRWPDAVADPQPVLTECTAYLWDLLADDQRLLINARCSIPVDGSAGSTQLLDLQDIARDSLIDGAGRQWAVNADGLFRIDGGEPARHVIGAFETLAEAPAGELWLAMMFGPHGEPEAALLGYRIADASRRHIALPAGTRVYDMHADDAMLWLATGRGLLRVDTGSGEVTTFVAPQPEAGRVFYSVQPDSFGALWVGSNRGLLRFDPLAAEGRRFRHFDARDGLAISEFNRRSHAVDAQGRLLFGGIGGVVRFDPSRSIHMPPAPQPRVTRALVWNRDGERSIKPATGETLALAADDLTVALEFAAPGFRRAGHVNFRYRLDGVDATWVNDAGARSARYPRLAPGDYVFRLQAGSDETDWREANSPLDLRFLPAWYESAWFRLPVLLTVVLAAWLLYRWRLARLLEMERLRLRIAADLHDEMGSELAAIGMSASMLGQREGLGANERRRLTGVAESAQKVAESMRDIVWYVNPEKDSVTALGERLQTLARRLFGEDGVSVHNGWRDDDAGLSMAVRRELHLICREALTNARRHAEADRIELRLDRDADGLYIEIADNGRGFVTDTRPDGNGLGNMARRAAAINAKLRIDSAPGQGTRIHLRLTHPRRGAGPPTRLA
ncbi:MAG: two-component regulator propeller domain-containing protein [Lysobacteraceae bacterium]